jgi:hypothetical protein
VVGGSGTASSLASAGCRKASSRAAASASPPGSRCPYRDELLILSYELRPGGNRLGAADLWARFDGTVEALRGALKMAGAGSVRYGLEDLSVALHDVAEEPRRIRGRSGQ